VPGIALPKKRFVHPEDTEEQIKRSATLYRSLFGDGGMGMWPSEGSVSESILPILKRNGIKWIATDEEIYYASLNSPNNSRVGLEKEKRGIHAPYLVGGKERQMGILFRDHGLSDKIGFVYSGWDANKAADDLVSQLEQMSKDDNSRVVSIILDGENCWEFYQNDGGDFLRSLYDKIEKSKLIETVLPSQIFADKSSITSLPYLFPGSWINHNFRVWIGHEEDNAAWDLLAETRDKLVEFQAVNPSFDRLSLEFAWREIYIAEGSDWCWWYGDEHHSDYFETFDYLFRKHLLNIWETIGVEPPVALKRPIRKTLKQGGIFEPTDFVTPIIDGKQTNYFEWFGAGKADCRKLGGAMHRGDSFVSQINFGYDDDFFYVRIDFESGQVARLSDESIKLEMICDTRADVLVERAKSFVRTAAGESGISESEIKAAWGNIVEMAIPRDFIPCDVDKHLHFSVAIVQKEKVIERWPEANYIFLEMPKRGESLFWQV
jgi:alpha-amylase/alpha-mannosidase (GH57 family)